MGMYSRARCSLVTGWLEKVRRTTSARSRRRSAVSWRRRGQGSAGIDTESNNRPRVYSVKPRPAGSAAEGGRRGPIAARARRGAARGRRGGPHARPSGIHRSSGRTRALTRERHQSLEGAVAAAHAGEAVRQNAAAEKLRELCRDERGKTTSLGSRLEGGDKIGEVGAHDLVEHARRRRARRVDTGHAARS
jgi:hypothetical protein